MATAHTFDVKDRDGAAHVIVCDSLGDARDYLQSHMDKGTLRASGFGFSDHNLKRLCTGDTKLVARADQIMERVEAVSLLSDSTPELARVVTGSVADIPAYLSGSPLNMRQRRRREGKAPLKIVVDVTSSGGISDAILACRGVAILALLRKLEAAGHAVELWLVSGLGGGATSLACVRMESAPLDLARTCWAFADTEMTRQTAYTLCSTNKSNNGSWPWNNKQWIGHADKQRAVYAQALGSEPDGIIFVPPLFGAGDADMPFRDDAKAAKWVSEQYALAIAPIAAEA